MNIRKFIGATSRDVLRLVREALGADAVVLSNRTLDDGSVEIVALADSELAGIAPAGDALHHAPSGGVGAAGGSQSVRAPRAAAPGGANPYASGGMPDVFSSVFGASPEVGAERALASVGDDAAEEDDEPAAHLTGWASAADSSGQPAAEAAAASPAADGWPAAKAAAPAGAEGNAARHGQPAGAAASPAAVMPQLQLPQSPSQPRTMAESNPWLIDHARRIASNEAGQGQNARRGMTPAAAMAKGLGMPAADSAAQDEATPEWAREAAQLAARRAAQRFGIAEEAPAAGAGLNEEAIRARLEQVVNETVMNELASMRGMMEEQFAGLMWGDRQRRSPVQGTLTRRLFAAGFSAQLVKMMVDRLPVVEDVEAGMEWVQSVLESNLPVLENEDALMERGGVFALMGPTGVGKTTTTAKLAARCVMRFGASRVALLTTDSYRIGGHEQLRIFGRILGVSVHAVRDGSDLQLALTELKNKHIVLIDTIGMSQRDRAVADQIAMLCSAGRPVQRLLLLAATSHGDTLNEVVQAYQSGPGEAPLAGCVLTKLDEATNLGGALDTVLRYKLPVHYVSTGQKVPENLYVATRRFLIRSAFCIPREHSPFVPHEDDIPALLSALSARPGAQAPEVQFG
ncbi:flagellar biosynthesis protein FlhF [Burkholderia sp. WAC0059]|uniref:flagellar biosynthesis protein FlhF n=1 Tax=Burkholderia sp. WAC0059 TaxID=2066022 RepID=UPI000C7F05B4|nr:flagellar biosynthesis protein FlhF [Burkholderia sp. WAC0059]PLZ00653.1 flagellar biosynthesis protein FlhF [Burkholderia sp. WAC0059]